MTPLITGSSDAIELALETAAQNRIPNAQSTEIAPNELNTFPDLERKYGDDILRRSGPTAVYNCHGLAFASRRTRIYDPSAVLQILHDDRYQGIAPQDVLPGDLIIYYDNSGDLEHSGIVVTPPSHSPLKVPKVYSKWGSYAEVIHFANRCPYDYSNVRYWRIQRDD